MDQIGSQYFKKIVRKIRTTPSFKEGVPFEEELWIIRFHYGKKKFCWNIILEKYDSFKIVLLTFYFCKNSEAKGLKKYNRNVGDESLNPLLTLQLFKECFYLCTRSKHLEEFSFGFYALDDNVDEVKEDMNKRMSAFSTFLYRDQIKRNYSLQNTGNLNNNLYIGYNPKYTTEKQVDNFISFYIPIMEKEIEELKKESSDSQKL